MDEQEELMPLTRALSILAEVHTQDHYELGFIVQMGAKPDDFRLYEYMTSQGDYIKAWRSVRHALNLPYDCPRKSEKPD